MGLERGTPSNSPTTPRSASAGWAPHLKASYGQLRVADAAARRPEAPQARGASLAPCGGGRRCRPRAQATHYLEMPPPPSPRRSASRRQPRSSRSRAEGPLTQRPHASNTLPWPGQSKVRSAVGWRGRRRRRRRERPAGRHPLPVDRQCPRPLPYKLKRGRQAGLRGKRRAHPRASLTRAAQSSRWRPACSRTRGVPLDQHVHVRAQRAAGGGEDGDGDEGEEGAGRAREGMGHVRVRARTCAGRQPRASSRPLQHPRRAPSLGSAALHAARPRDTGPARLRRCSVPASSRYSATLRSPSCTTVPSPGASARSARPGRNIPTTSRSEVGASARA
jgi:hypothetical protein